MPVFSTPSAVGAWLARPVPPGGAGLRTAIPLFVARRFIRAYLARLPEPSPAPGDARLDVFLRIGPRDLSVAPMALASLRQYLVNQIGEVVIATPAAHLDDVRRTYEGVDVVADEDLLSSALRDAVARATCPDRVTWVRQQFLTLVHVSTRAQRPCLVWDADTVMVRPQTLLTGRVAALAISSEHHQPYFTLIRALFPDLLLPEHSSTVAHHMVMDPELLRALFDEIESRRPGCPWWRALLDLVDPQEASPIADYELYGQWVRNRHPDRIRLVGFRNVALSRRRFLAGSLNQWVGRRTDSVSTHWWIPEADL